MTQTLPVRKQNRSNTQSLIGLALAAAVTGVAAYTGRQSSPSSDHPRTKLWWALQRKPPLTPPGAVFAAVWPALWSLEVLSAWRVWNAPDSRERTQALTAWAAQTGLNALWPKVFFGDHRKGQALGVITANLAAACAYAHLATKVDATAGALAAPMPVWLGFASYLNEEVLRRN